MKKVLAMIMGATLMLGTAGCGKPEIEELKSSDCWIVAYTRNEAEGYSSFLARSVHFAITTDSGKSFETLYNNYGKLFAKCNFNEENGIVSMGAHDIEIYRLGDEYIITAKETKRTKLADGNYPERDTGMFIRWTTKDFITFSEPEVCESRLTRSEEKKCNETSVSISPEGIDYSEKAVSISISEEMASKLVHNNITVEFESVDLPKSVTVSSKEELEKVTATVTYTDGSTHEKHIKWDLDGIDFTKAGKHTVKGEIVVRRFPFPVENHPWADPVITYYNGKYYFIATNDANGNTSFEIREADSPEALFEPGVRREVILDAATSAFKSTFWAPEFHIVGGKLRIFCALSIEGFDPQCYIMTLSDGGDVLNKDDWSVPIRVVMPDERYLGVNPLGDNKNGITLDMTYFEAGGKSYAVWSYRTWAGTDSGSMLMIAQMNPDNPRKLLSYPQLLTRPYYGWEHNSGTDNNEGPYALVTDDKVYLAYSGGDARGPMYVIGMLTANVGDDLLDISNWETSPAPRLASNFVEGEYGPGHNAFFTDEYGDVYITYHGNKTLQRTGIIPGIRRVHFLSDGTPLLYMTSEQDLPKSEAEVKITVIVEP